MATDDIIQLVDDCHASARAVLTALDADDAEFERAERRFNDCCDAILAMARVPQKETAQ